jgi:hypothetical protein
MDIDKNHNYAKYLIDEVLVNLDTQLQKDIRAIVLEGSFSRNEGVIINVDAVDQPLNDIDLYVILERKKHISSIRSKLVEIVKHNYSFRIDIDIVVFKDLPKLNNTLRNYDLRNTGKVIYGDVSVLKFLPQFQLRKIQFSEYEKLFITRLIGFFLYYSRYSTISNNDIPHFQNQMAKAVIAATEIQLMQLGKYNSSYRKNFHLSMNTTQFKKYYRIIQWAYNNKLGTIENEDYAERVNLYRDSYEYCKKSYLLVLRNKFHLSENILIKVINIIFWLKIKRIILFLISAFTHGKSVRAIIIAYLQYVIFFNDKYYDYKLENMPYWLIIIVKILFKVKMNNTDEMFNLIIKERM